MRDLVGIKFTRLKVLKLVSSKPPKWLCICDCGTKRTVYGSNLLSRKSKSCNCLRDEVTKNKNLSHGMSNTRLFGIWTGIQTRTKNKNCIAYKDYGKRGIKNEWKSFEEFYKDMNPSYLKHIKKFGEKDTTIERKKSKGNYSKSNCKWATRAEQTVNKRNSKNYKLFGKTLNLSEWVKKYKNGNHRTQYIKTWKRLQRGWGIKKALDLI